MLSLLLYETTGNIFRMKKNDANKIIAIKNVQVGVDIIKESVKLRDNHSS